jgi:imidazolonepropionase-like amidohydrolase
MLKLEGQVGRVKEGFFADLVLLKKDPLTDPSAYRSPELIFKGGVAKTPAEWLGEKRKAGG